MSLIIFSQVGKAEKTENIPKACTEEEKLPSLNDTFCSSCDSTRYMVDYAKNQINMDLIICQVDWLRGHPDLLTVDQVRAIYKCANCSKSYLASWTEEQVKCLVD